MNITRMYGLTEMLIKRKLVIISHSGNMGTGIDRVRENVDHMCGQEGVFDELRKVGSEDGFPDYHYTLVVPRKEYDEVVDDAV